MIFNSSLEALKYFRGGMGQWVELRTPNISVISSNPIKGSRCFLEPHCLVLVGSRKRISINLMEALLSSLYIV